MKHASPPRKVVPTTMTQFEENLMTKLFDNPRLKDKNRTIIGPLSPAIFCYDRTDGFDGDFVAGISEKLCGSFFPFPSDVGMCLTKDSNINEIMHSQKEYDSLFEPHLQGPIKKFSNNTIWSKITLVLYADGENDLQQTVPRSSDANLDELEFLIHPPNELAKFIEGESFERQVGSLTLKGGNEYLIDVTPHTIKVSDDYKGLELERRNCFANVDESPNLKLFKNYSRNNCRYECHVERAQDKCQCTPWDFVSFQQNLGECDVFGRQCFFDTIRKLSHSSIDSCPHCIDLCETTKYFVTKVTKESLAKKLVANGDTWTAMRKINMKWIRGEKELVEFFEDKNNSLSDQRFREVYNAFGYPFDNNDDYEWLHFARSKNIIIVHLDFQKPKVKMIDLKYTSMDKIANFGGKFGIFAQITGCSLLAIIKIVFVIFKTCFTFKNHH